jgi:hypothetical protein
MEGTSEEAAVGSDAVDRRGRAGPGARRPRSQGHGYGLEVTDAEGKAVLVNLNEKTKVLRGKTAAKAVDIASGEKVVVIYQQVKGKAGKEQSIAKEVRLGPVAAAAK